MSFFYNINIVVPSRVSTQIVLCVVQFFRVGTRLVLRSKYQTRHFFTGRNYSRSILQLATNLPKTHKYVNKFIFLSKSFAQLIFL